MPIEVVATPTVDKKLLEGLRSVLSKAVSTDVSVSDQFGPGIPDVISDIDRKQYWIGLQIQLLGPALQDKKRQDEVILTVRQWVEKHKQETKKATVKVYDFDRKLITAFDA